MRRILCLVGLALAAAPLAGCGSGARTYEVTGEVTFDGQPVPEGDILFAPDDPSLAPEGGKIKGGRYQLRAKAGRYRVEVRASRPGKPGPMGPVYESYIPEEYNNKTTLRRTVSPDRPNQFDFALLSKPPPGAGARP
jgi:hypothetical protein